MGLAVTACKVCMMHLGRFQMFSRIMIIALALVCTSCKAGDSILDNYSVNEQNRTVISELKELLDSNELSQAKELLSRNNIDIDTADNRGRTLLIAAILSEEHDAAKMLLKLGANPNFLPSGKHKSAMGWAAQYKNTKFLQLLLDFGGNPDLFNKGERTASYPVLSAISADRIDNLKLLIDAGANLNVVDQRGLTPLMYGASVSAWEMVYLILESGADISVKNKWNESFSTYVAQPDFGTTGDALEWRKKVISFLQDRGITIISQK